MSNHASGVTSCEYSSADTALVVVDPYNEFISEGGKLWPAIQATAQKNNCVPNMIQLRKAASAANVRLFIAPHHRWREGDYQLWKHWAPIQHQAADSQGFKEGSWGGQFHPAFAPTAADVVAQEHWCSSGFANTDLDMQLKKLGLTKLILCGMTANTCLESTMRYAIELGYEVTMVSDATAAFSEEGMQAAIGLNWPVYASAIHTTEEVVAKLAKLRA